MYAVIVTVRAKRQTEYQPVLEDWFWHAVFPLSAYGALTAAALALPRRPEAALFVVAAAALLLMYVGIHNSWDTVTFIATDPRSRRLVNKPKASTGAAGGDAER